MGGGGDVKSLRPYATYPHMSIKVALESGFVVVVNCTELTVFVERKFDLVWEAASQHPLKSASVLKTHYTV